METITVILVCFMLFNKVIANGEWASRVILKDTPNLYKPCTTSLLLRKLEPEPITQFSRQQSLPFPFKSYFGISCSPSEITDHTFPAHNTRYNFPHRFPKLRTFPTHFKSDSILEYKPMRPSFVPNPVTIGQRIPPGTPWPAFAAGYSTTVAPTIHTEACSTSKPYTVLEYKPSRPWFVPEPITVGQRIPPGKPWPAYADGYSTTTPLATKTEASKKTSINPDDQFEESHTVLEYKPTRPSFVPEPVTIGQRIPPGKPWPASAAGYTTTAPPATKTEASKENSVNPDDQFEESHTVLEYKPTRPSFVPDPVTIGQRIPPGKPWPASAAGYTTTAPLDTKTEASKENSVNPDDQFKEPHTVLEYKPTQPSFVPDPVTIGQRIPPGKPWPASAAGYTTTAPPDTKTEASKENSVNPDDQFEEPYTVLEYKPTRPSFVPDPVTIGQRIPPGKPLPASVDGYTTAAPLATKTEASKENSVNPEDQFEESHTVLEYKPTQPSFVPDPLTIGQRIPPGKPLPASVDSYTTAASLTTKTETSKENSKDKMEELFTPLTPIVLEYKPSRPFFVPNPVTIPQRIPPGTPWPASGNPYTNSQSIQSTNPTVVSFSEPTSATEESTTILTLEYKPQKPWYVSEDNQMGQIIPPGKPWPASADSNNTTVPPTTKTESTEPSTTHTVLDYKPSQPFVVLNPVTVAQKIPPGTPWPTSTNVYTNPQNIPSVNPATEKSTIHSLGYKPQKPWYISDCNQVGQIIPPGKPWPGSLKEYEMQTPCPKSNDANQQPESSDMPLSTDPPLQLFTSKLLLSDLDVYENQQDMEKTELGPQPSELLPIDIDF